MKALVLLLLPCLSYAGPVNRDLRACDNNAVVEQNGLSTTAALEFNIIGSSTSLPVRSQVCIRNYDSTAANEVWVSSFNVTSLVSGVLDTSKAWPIPGGKTGDSEVCRPWGPNVRFWLFRAISSAANAIVSSCQ
jgi:hypothetical protein